MKHFVFSLLVGVGALAATTNAGAADIKKGDSLVVTYGNAPLMRGRATLANVAAGQRIKVLRTEGNWVGTRIKVNGREVSGWIWRNQLATPEQFARRQTTRRYSYQPGTSVRRYSAMPGPAVPSSGYNRSYYRGGYNGGGSGSGSSFIMGGTRYGPGYWRADRKITGY